MIIYKNKKKGLLILFYILFISTLCFSSAGETITRFLKDYRINPYLIIFLISTLPIVELRGAIPIGILLLELNWILVIIISIVGNILPIFFVLYIFKFVEKALRYIPLFDKFFNKLFDKTIARSKSIERFEELGLMFYVGIPLPITGAWTGSLIAYLLKLSYFKAIGFIFIGVLFAAFIVSTMTFFKIKGLIIGISILTLITLIGIIKSEIDKKKNKID